MWEETAALCCPKEYESSKRKSLLLNYIKGNKKQQMTTHIHVAWKSQGLKIKSFTEEKRNADLMCFQGSFNRKEDTQTVNVNTAVVIISGDMTFQLLVPGKVEEAKI